MIFNNASVKNVCLFYCDALLSIEFIRNKWGKKHVIMFGSLIAETLQFTNNLGQLTTETLQFTSHFELPNLVQKVISPPSQMKIKVNIKA